MYVLICLWIAVDTDALMGPLVTPKTSILGTQGGHFGGPGFYFGDSGHPLDARRDVWDPDVEKSADFDAQKAPTRTAKSPQMC